MRKTRPKKADPAANMFTLAVDAEGNEHGVGRVDSLEALRRRITENMAAGLFTEVVILNLRQLTSVMSRILK